MHSLTAARSSLPLPGSGHARRPAHAAHVRTPPRLHAAAASEGSSATGGGDSAGSDWAAFTRLMFLPGSSGGAWFRTDADAGAPVYGQSFVMQPEPAAAGVGAAGRRGRYGSSAATGLVRVVQRPATAVQLQPQQPVGLAASNKPLLLSVHSDDEVEVSIVVLPPEGAEGDADTDAPAATALATTASTSSIVPFRRLLAGPAVTDEQLAADVAPPTDSSGSSASLAIVPRDSTMFGVVMSSAVRRRDDGVQLPPDEVVYETPFNDKNPRRTMKIKFTCKRCGATTIKPINPHAWATGTVFAKCGGCQVTHKLIDNLKLFHELAGPCFGPATQAPPPPPKQRLGLRLDADVPPPLRLRLPLPGFPEDTAGLN